MYEHMKYPQTAYQYASFMHITIVKKNLKTCAVILHTIHRDKVTYYLYQTFVMA
jgi:hypothetical protein